MGFPILVRCHLYIESGPCFQSSHWHNPSQDKKCYLSDYDSQRLVRVNLFIWMAFYYAQSHSLQLGQMSYPDKILAESMYIVNVMIWWVIIPRPAVVVRLVSHDLPQHGSNPSLIMVIYLTWVTSTAIFAFFLRTTVISILSYFYRHRAVFMWT